MLDGKDQAAALKHEPQESALLKFMHDRSEKKIIDKRALRRALKGVAGSNAKSEKAREKQSSRESRKEKRAKERELARGSKVIKSISTPRTILSRETKDSSFFSGIGVSTSSTQGLAVGSMDNGRSASSLLAPPRKSRSGKSDRSGAANVGGVTQNPEIKVIN